MSASESSFRANSRFASPLSFLSSKLRMRLSEDLHLKEEKNTNRLFSGKFCDWAGSEE